MGFDFISDFKEIGNSCAVNCYLENLDLEQKDSSFKKKVIINLGVIVRSCEDKKTKNLAKGALGKCKKCNYQNPNVFDYLDRRGIRF